MICCVTVVDIKVFFILSTFLSILRSCEFDVDDVDGKDYKEEESLEVADIRLYHFSRNILQ